MSLATLLSTRVESLLPRTAAAACISPDTYCDLDCFLDGGHEKCLHKICRISCHGKTLGCGGWLSGGCSS